MRRALPPPMSLPLLPTRGPTHVAGLDTAPPTTLLDDVLHALPPPLDGTGGSADSPAVEQWASAAAESFERNGVLSLPALLDSSQLDKLRAAVATSSDEADELWPVTGYELYASADEDEMDDGDGEVRIPELAGDSAPDDFTAETREAACRTHRALRIDGDVVAILGTVTARLWPLLAKLLQSLSKLPLCLLIFLRLLPTVLLLCLLPFLLQLLLQLRFSLLLLLAPLLPFSVLLFFLQLPLLFSVPMLFSVLLLLALLLSFSVLQLWQPLHLLHL